jgi:hypothetical protein
VRLLFNTCYECSVKNERQEIYYNFSQKGLFCYETEPVASVSFTLEMHIVLDAFNSER